MSVAGFLREAEALRRLVCKEEREARRHELRDTSSALRDHMNAQLVADTVKVQQQLQKLQHGVFRFQEQLMDVRPTPDAIDRLRETMSEIENSISAFKDAQHQSFEELLKDERSVWQEICVFERKMDSWSVSVRADGGPRRSEKPCSGSSLPAEVSALQTFLQQTGRDGGWDPFDHRSFLRVWTRHRGKPSYRREAQLYLPEKTEEEVKRHEEWFLELRRLQDDKREAIRRWRAVKRSEREQQRDADEEPRETQEKQETQEQLEERRREASERIQAWRRLRSQQREEQRQQQLREQIVANRRAKEERRRQLEQRLLVDTHLQQKQRQREQAVLEREAQEQLERRERQRHAAHRIRRFQQRDTHRLEQKLQEKQSKEQEQSERRETLEKLKQKVAVHIGRDPSRLWRLTEAWQERTKEIGPSGTGPVLQIFHRAVPAWRQDS